MWTHINLLQASPDQEISFEENSDLSRFIRRPENKVLCITVHKIRYIWNLAAGMFQNVGVLEDKYSCSDIHNIFGAGLSTEGQNIRRQLCGPNTIEIEILPIWKLLYKEILNPSYIFQVFTLCTWLAFGYTEYSMVVLILTILSVTAITYSLRKQSIKLHSMVESHNNVKVSVLQKNGAIEEVESRYLVPGDVIILTGKQLDLPCDAILISGGCIVNEGLLTGESIPVTKVPLPYLENAIPWKTYLGDNYKGHVLYCGTQVIKTKPHGDGLVKAVVLQTGFNTTKGDLVKTILYPKPINFKLHRDAFKIIIGLIILSFIGAIYTTTVYVLAGAPAKDVIMMCLIMATVAVPVSLPPALSINLLYSQHRLKKMGIFCISPQRINLCGQLNLFCFDKTGTLTEDGLDLWGIVPSQGKGFQEVQHCYPGCALRWSPLLGAMASCHSLVVLDGKINGDPLDLKMFEGSGWEIYMKEDGNSEACMVVKPGAALHDVPVKGICILHQFPFSSSLQRMSVITQFLGENQLTVYLKGAPETVIHFCKQETVPSSFSCKLDYYTKQGFRVIGLAYKSFRINGEFNMGNVSREEVEKDLLFLGFLIMENRLKPETKPVLQELISANIRNVMLTGDNLQTACTVGTNSGMVPDSRHLVLIEATDLEEDIPPSVTWHFMETERESIKKETTVKTEQMLSQDTRPNKYHYAMSGKSYQVIKEHFPSLVPDMIINGTIFARMSPKHKSSIIEDFQKLEYNVGMCGDGANDCGALKMAHAGIALSELEASVASPFTSKIQNIQCVPKLLKEGRNAYVTSIALFKYMITYTLIGFFCMLLLFSKQTVLGNFQYLIQDLLITTAVTLAMSLNGPADKLAPYRPALKMFSPSLLLSIALQLILTISVQTTAFILVQQQPWYNESNVFSACDQYNQSYMNQTIIRKESQNFLTSTLGPVTGLNHIIVEFVYSRGSPFRQPIYTNSCVYTSILENIHIPYNVAAFCCIIHH
ncbi:probable cation-transporting ATPase 13A5 [Bombina bombina]|uniref:probable cation-transporting ATPase 13A5 n=1 Tax=Bombina bombina TaxID=8345 RepID=UPI00235AAE80|nr:probable cation-transporting ATPase 13A5 [Bombina bombina]